MSIDGPGREQLRTLAARLKEAGEEGQGLRRKVQKQINEAVKPLKREIADVEHLKPYMPDRYAAILAADLTVKSVSSAFAANPGVTIRARARDHDRKLGLIEDGRINHPVFARGRKRRKWTWENGQTAGMRQGFFTDPCEKATPEIREHVLKAITETAKKIADG